MNEKANDNPAVSLANLESNSGYEPLETEEAERPNPPYDIHIHSIRKRPGDIDGISAKAAIDGLIKAGILGDDSTEWIQKISLTQEKGKEEYTVITIEEVDDKTQIQP